ncbi:MAG TPA: cytochrome C oxidase subunit IV family protein [Tepidisphaeraceae bacterium]|nr:cytochrome C oxidase subunit IV family protein [Tepidisphaeraceae bacterium]
MASHAITPDPGARHYAAPDDKPEDLSYSTGTGSAHVHVTSPMILLAVYGVLVALTILTVTVTKIDFGADFNVWVAIGIAFAKATLVGLYFMHLRWENPFNGIILLISLFFVALFIGVCVMDSHEYQKNYLKPGVAGRP